MLILFFILLLVFIRNIIFNFGFGFCKGLVFKFCYWKLFKDKVLELICYFVLWENFRVCSSILVLGFLLVICCILGKVRWIVLFSEFILLLIDMELDLL